jgi:HTH-type transcriptional repressor of NAD biosynthesis genes
MSKQYRHALVLGKFLPPHVGHLSLVRFAREFADRVTVLVDQQVDEPIATDTRVEWMREATSNEAGIEIKPLYGENPPAPPGDPEGDTRFWKHWAGVLKKNAPGLDLVVSADDYGARLAADQGNCHWMPFDRSIFPISATSFKSSPWERWPWLINPAQRALLRRLVIVGAESTGKSHLSQRLATSSIPPTIVVPEYAEHWIRRNPDKPWDDSALELFLTGQAASRAALRGLATRWIMEDSHALTTGVWAAQLGHHDLAHKAFEAAKQDRPHHVILASIEGAFWVSDHHRKDKSDLQAFENAFREKLDEFGWTYDIVRGDWATRTEQSLDARDKWLERWRVAPWADWTQEATEATLIHGSPRRPRV